MRLLYANLGRGTKGNVTRSWQSLADTANHDDLDAAVIVEVDEGDHGYSDHAIAARMFKGWRRRFWRRMVVVLVNPKHKPTDAKVSRANDSAVKRWSPSRYVVELVLPSGDDTPDTLLIGVHYAAGYKNGQRPSWARPLLATSWLATRQVHRRRVRRAHRRGMHSVTLMDCNDHAYDATYLHPSAEVLFGRGGSDWGVAVPAAGWEVKRKSDRPVATYVERFHQGHEVAVVFGRR